MMRHMALIGRRRVTMQVCCNPLSPLGLLRHGASRCVTAPRRCSGIACVAAPDVSPHGASNATVSTSTTDY